MDAQSREPLKVHLVSSSDSPEFALLNQALTRTSLVGLDAEWKPVRAQQTSFPTVSLLQIACQLNAGLGGVESGFRFKQDLAYLSSTFCSQGCDPGFDKVDPYLDITNVYNHLQHKKHGRSISKQIKSLSTICGEVLGFSLSKELQCSDWSCRPLTEEQMTYAALDAHCLLEIFDVFREKILKEGNSLANTAELSYPGVALGLKEVFREHDGK
ncbi:hypothetical protein K1719_025897 [Acacia pycnantha]|nr:hypothetical protein K1719_025897 [Acacia pycnantha]